MPIVKVVTKAEASKTGKSLDTPSSAHANSTTAKTIAEQSVTKRKVHEAPKTGSVSRATAKRAVKKAILNSSQNSSKK